MKLSKVFSIVIVAVMLMTAMTSVVFAGSPAPEEDDGSVTIGGITVRPNKDTNAADKVNTLGGSVLGVIQTVGTIAAIVTLIVLGVKYMMGSAEEKAEYKKTLVPYVIGAILVLLASNIVKWVFDAASGFFG